MTLQETTRSFLCSEVDSLEPLGFVAIVPAGSPLQVVEIARGAGDELRVTVPGRPGIAPELPLPMRSALHDRGFSSEEPADQTKAWSSDVDDAKASVDLAQRVLFEVLGARNDQPFDIFHGSHRAEHEAREKLELVRKRLDGLLAELLEDTPQQDADGDFLLPIGDVQVTVAPRALPGGPVVIRVFAVTNVNLAVTPELGLFLARLNFGLMFGRFALDTEHQAVWFDETLLGEQCTDEELRFAVKVVASTADEWDDRLKQMFGGATHQEILSMESAGQTPPVKPGEGPGLYL